MNNYALFNEYETDEKGLYLHGDREYIGYFRKNNLIACQFHPEKSGVIGRELILNIVEENYGVEQMEVH